MAVLVILGLLVCASIAWNANRARRLREAKEAYQAALAALSANPSDNNLRIRALEAGRYYADLARKYAGGGRRAVFDEVALSNDLSARSGASPSAPAPASAASGTKTCPQCAESVKREARICRFCQHKFEAAA